MHIPPRILIISIIATVSVTALFCVIGLGTNGWYGGATGLFCSGCPQAPKGLSIIAFFLLLGTIPGFVLLMLDKLQGFIRYLPIALLFVSTIFLLATFTAAAASSQGYSFNLMVASHFFTYVALAAAAYWYGQNGTPTTQTN